MKSRQVLLGIGSNVRGRFGDREGVLEAAGRLLQQAGCGIVAQSPIVESAPLGPVRQARYLNRVLLITAPAPPAALLRLVKRIERAAGRRLGVRWGPRVLDIDILDFGGRIVGHPARQTRRGSLTLPHPGLTERGFVLIPLAMLAPDWRHPILGASARSLLARRPRLARGITVWLPKTSV